MSNRALVRILATAGLACLLAQPSAAQSSAQTSGSQAWWERIDFGGDFRGRYEGNFQAGLQARNRQKFRLRLTARAAVNDELSLTLRIASGDPGDPTSANQNFTDSFTRKPINIDQAALVYTPKAAPALTFGGGKFGYPFVRTQLLWDDDLNWEGLYQQLALAPEGLLAFKLIAVQSPVEEVSGGKDAFMFAEQGQVIVTAGKHSVLFALASYNFQEVDQVAIAFDRDELRTQNTNLVRRDPSGRVVGFVSGFNLVDVIAQATLATPRAEYPVTLLVDWVTNTRAATDAGTAYWITATYGRASRVKTASVSYTYARIEQDGILSTFSFSDTPGSNLRANIVRVSYMPLPRFHIDVTGLFTKPLEVAPGADKPLLSTVLVDLMVSF